MAVRLDTSAVYEVNAGLDRDIQLAAANEQIRQEAAAFETQLRQYQLWMRARRAMLWTGVGLLPAVVLACSYVLLFHESFSSTVVATAGAALFVDSLGIVGAVWKGAMSLEPPAPPVPLTSLAAGRTSMADTGEDDGRLATAQEGIENDVERRAGDGAPPVAPDLVSMAGAARTFLARTVRYLAEEARIRQFIDIGSGSPTANTREIAQAVGPDLRMVYVGSDPVALNQTRALVATNPRGGIGYVNADLRDTDAILYEAARTLDFTEPIGVVLLGTRGTIEYYDEARAAVQRLFDVLPSGSYLLVGGLA